MPKAGDLVFLQIGMCQIGGHKKKQDFPFGFALNQDYWLSFKPKSYSQKAHPNGPHDNSDKVGLSHNRNPGR